MPNCRVRFLTGLLFLFAAFILVCGNQFDFTIPCFNSRTRVGCDSRNDNMFILLYQRGGFREPRDIGGRNRSSFQFRYFNLQRTKLLESPRTFRSFSYSLMFAEAIKSGESRQYRRRLWFLCEELYCLLSFP